MELDVSHLLEKGVGYARHQSPLKEVSDAHPTQMIRVLLPFMPLFSKRVWQHAQVLLAGAMLAPGARTVSSALRAMGLDQEERFHRYHRVLRACANRRVSYVSKSSKKAVQSLREMSCAKGCPPIGAAS